MVMAATVNSPVSIADTQSAIRSLWVMIHTIPEGTPIEENCTLTQPITARLELTQDGFLVQCPWLDEEAFGRTQEEAIHDFLTSLRDRCRSLGRREEQLPLHDRSILQRLRRLLAER